MTKPVSSGPIVFAHRGGKRHERANTVAAFKRAIDHGATGIETDAFLTKDGVVVLAHGAKVGRWPAGKRLIRDAYRADLPTHIPDLETLFETVSKAHHVFIDIKDVAAAPFIAKLVTQNRDPNDVRLWLAHAGFNQSERRTVAAWAQDFPGVKLVDSTSVVRMSSDPERYIKALVGTPINCLNLPITEWNEDLVRLCREAGLHTLAFRVHTKRRARKALRLGLEAMHGDNVDAMVSALKPDA